MRPFLLVALALLATPLSSAVTVTPEEVRASCVGIRWGIPPGISVTLSHCLPDIGYTWQQVCKVVPSWCHDQLP